MGQGLGLKTKLSKLRSWPESGCQSCTLEHCVGAPERQGTPLLAGRAEQAFSNPLFWIPSMSSVSLLSPPHSRHLPVFLIFLCNVKWEPERRSCLTGVPPRCPITGWNYVLWRPHSILAQVGRNKLEERRADKMVRVRVRVVRVRCFNQKVWARVSQT